MNNEEIIEKLNNLKSNYLKYEKLYNDYAKCVEQYYSFLMKLYENVCRLMVNKKYQDIDGNAYFNKNQEFSFEIDVLDYSLDFIGLIDNLIKQNDIGNIELIPSSDKEKPILIKIKYNSNKQIKEVEKIIWHLLPQKEENKEVEISR